ncbi:alanine racemase [Propionibacterium sp.]|uniref:alanine racemase n=1 Tax=Propionibacterium sp. TaxID=1977903 RepID=UPI0039E8CC28
MLYATHLTIDLDAVRHNARVIRAKAGDRLLLAAVKADGYGHGAVEISRLLEREQLVDWLGVATVPEAIALREAGIGLPILKLSHAFAEEIPAALDAELTLTVVDDESLGEVAAAARARVRPTRVHMAIDTGMRRIGCEPERAVELARQVTDSGLELEGISTHLPVSDTPQGKDFTVAQIAEFMAAVARVQSDRTSHGLAPVPLVHGAASAGAMWHDISGMTMVRPGIILYGLYPDPATPRTVALRPALTMRSRVSLVKHVRAHETVGYGRSWEAPTDRWIGTVPVGYADGFNRLNSNRGRMLVNGRSFPVAGRVCMDQTMLDLGESDDHGVHRGDEVVVIGSSGAESIDCDELARLAGTINYEVTTVIPPRVRRYYMNGAGDAGTSSSGSGSTGVEDSGNSSAS